MSPLLLPCTADFDIQLSTAMPVNTMRACLSRHSLEFRTFKKTFYKGLENFRDDAVYYSGACMPVSSEFTRPFIQATLHLWFSGLGYSKNK